jgi:hypothetical protein
MNVVPFRVFVTGPTTLLVLGVVSATTAAWISPDIHAADKTASAQRERFIVCMQLIEWSRFSFSDCAPDVPDLL